MPTRVKTFYELPHCSTCQKAKAFLKAYGASIAETVDVKTQPVSRETLKSLGQQLGGVEALFSKRALKYRAMGLNERTLSDEEMLDLMQDEYTFIRRPVVVTDNGKILAGFSEKQYKALLGA